VSLKKLYFSIGMQTAAPETLLYRIHNFFVLIYAKAVRKGFITPLNDGLGKINKKNNKSANLATGALNIILPSGNNHLTQEEFNHCCEIIDYFMQEKEKLIPYCKAHDRNPALFERDNVWQESFVDATTTMLLSKKYNNINRLRLIGWHFSAYRVFDLTSVTEPPSSKWFQNFYDHGMQELPDNIDKFIQEAVNPQDRIELLVPRLHRLMERVDNKYLHGQPLRFGEVAGEYNGLLVNGDSGRYWGTMVVLYRSGILQYLEERIAKNGFCRVMEIGAGYGGLAYQLKKTFGEKLQFIAVDLTESLIFSACYLTALFKDETLFYKDEKNIDAKNGLVFVPTFRSPEFFDATHDIDLCINTISMNEMASAQVDYYGKNIAKVLAPEGIFFECNWNAAKGGPGRIDVKSYLALHFNHRLSLANTEVASDGNLDLWSNAMSSVIQDACDREYNEYVTYYKR
jgi:SAM-dependent methyltransferase